MKKRIISLLLCLVMVVGLLPVTAYAALPTMTAQIDGDYLRWPAVEDAEVYCLLIDYKAEYVVAQKTSSGVQKNEQSFNLKEYCKTRYPNKWLTVQIRAYSNYPASGGTALTELLDVGSYTNTASTVTQLTTPSNIQWSGFTVSWDTVINATGYRVVLTREYYVLGTSYSENYYVIETATPSVNIRDYCVPDITDYRLSITATTTAAGYINSGSGYAYKRYTETELAGLTSRALQNVSFNEETGVLSWDAFSTATMSYLLQVFTKENSGYVHSAKTTIPTGSGRMMFDVKNFCIEKDLPSVDGFGIPASNYRVLLSACDAKGDKISAAWREDDYILNYNPAAKLTDAVSYSGAARYGATLTANVTGAPTGAALNYQWQVKDGGAWKDISGATVQTYSPNDDAGTMVGKEIRVKVTATNCHGMLYSASKTVTKAAAPGAPGAPALSVTTAENTATVTFEPVGTAEYIYKVVSDADATLTAWPDSGYTAIDGNSFEVTMGESAQIVRVYTRYKETPTRGAGTHLSSSKIIIPALPASSGGDGGSETPSDAAATSLIYPDYAGMPTVYVKKGETVTVRYQLAPANADTNLPTWKEENIGGEDYPYLTVTQITQDNASGIGTITIKGDKVTSTGGVSVTPYKNDTEQWGSNNDIAVVVYDPTADLADVPLIYTDLGSVDLYTGKTYDLGLANLKETLDFLPAGVSKDGYTLGAFVLNSGTPPTFATDNTDACVKVNATTGVIEVQNAGTSTVYVVALASGETASVTKYIATLTVNVAAKPTAETELTVAPGAVTLWTGETYQLTATKTLAAEGDTFTWSSSADTTATVDTTGKVTAVAAGTATITATCGGATATCVITVKAPCGENHAYVYQECDWGHVKECGLCGHSDNVILDHNIFWKESTEVNGKMYGECLDCGYKTDLVNISSNEVPTDPTPDTLNRPNLPNNPDSSTGGYHSGAGRPYCPDLSTVVPESTTATKPGSTVQSPGTGDAGIVLYAALSMLSMTGGAWLVSKKRRER